MNLWFQFELLAIVVGCGSFLGGIGAVECRSKTETKPNFIVMLMDDMGYGDLGVMGEPSRETPNIDRMAAEGMLMPEFYTGAAICSPSRASLLTGRLPIRNGFYSNNAAGHNAYTPQDIVGGISSSEILLPKILRRSGYKSALIGKWHLGHREQYLPLRHGFDTWFGAPNCHFGPYNDKTTPNIPVYDNDKMVGRYYEKFVINRTTGESNYTQLLLQKSLEFIRSQKNGPQPFFLLFTPDSSHGPHYASKKFLGKSRRGLYGDAVMELDSAVGVILEELRSSNMTNTLVIFSSDNGAALVDRGYGGSNGPLMCGKQTTFEGGFRVPTVAWWPNVIRAGRTSYQVGTQMDIFATLASLSGQSLPGDRKYDGISLENNFRTGSVRERSVFYYRGNRLMAVRIGKYKSHVWTFTTPPEELKKRINHCPGRYVKNVTTSFQVDHTHQPIVFDLARDPAETYPLLTDTAEYRAAVERARKEIAKHNNFEPGRPALDWCDPAVMNWAPPGCQQINDCLRVPKSRPFKCYWPH